MTKYFPSVMKQFTSSISDISMLMRKTLNTKGETKPTTWKARFSENSISESFSELVGKFLDIRRKAEWTAEKKAS